MIRAYEEVGVGAWHAKASRSRLVTVVGWAGRAYSIRGASTTASWTVGADIARDILIAGACASAWCSSCWRILDAIDTGQAVCRIRSTASCT